MTDERLEVIVANLLRGGVLTSAAVVLAGGILYVLQHGSDVASYHVFHGEPSEYTSPAAIVQGAFAGNPRAIIQLGLLLLIATPVARVAISIAGFALEKDRAYVVITIIVLAILLFSLIAKP
jgi:uncharacterized membrane protein